MTMLQSRPSSGTGETRDRAPEPAVRVRRPLTVSALLSGAGAALAGLVVLQAVALAGWFAADGGGHGTTRDALRVGADAWLVGHGAHLTYAGVDYTLVPLGLPLLLAWGAYQAGAWAGRSALGTSQPVDDREAGLALCVHTCGYLVVAVVTAVLAGTPGGHGSVGRTVLGALVLGGGVGGTGLLVGCRRTDLVCSKLPASAGPVVRGAATTLLGLLTVSALLVLVSFTLHLDSAMSLVSQLGLHRGDSAMLALASATLAPNAVAYATSYLLGPGFAVGVGTTVSPAAVTIGPLPSFPLLAALPDGRAVPWVATVLLALPPVVAAVSVALVQRRDPARSWDAAILRGVASGVLAALAVSVLGALAGGALGDGRMSDLGPSAPRLFVSACLALGLGGLAGGLAGLLLGRRAPAADDDTDDTEPTTSLELPRVLVPSRPDEPTVQLDLAAEESFGLRELRARFQEQTGHPRDDDA